MSTFLDWQTSILRRLEEGLPHTKVHLEGVPESTSHPKDPTGFIKPFLIIWFGQLGDLASMTGGVKDLCGGEGGGETKNGTFLIQVVAPTGLSLIHLENLVRSLLTGFRPAGEGELTETGSTIRDPYPIGVGDTLRMYKPLYFQGVVTSFNTAVI